MISRLMDRLASIFDLVVRLIVVVFMIAPAIVITLLSFSNDYDFAFPPKTWGLDQYRYLRESPEWIDSVTRSFAIATPTALLCLAIGVPAVIALNRTKMPGRGIINALGLAPLVLPAAAYAVAMYIFFVEIDVLYKPGTLILVYVALSLPLVMLIVGASLRRISPDLELVAMTLGASRFRASVGITVRLLMPAIAATFLFCFIHAFDEATFINFIGGSENITFPRAIIFSIENGLDPVVNAISTLLMVATGLLVTAATYLRTERKR